MFYILVSTTVCLFAFFVTPAEKIHAPELFKALSSCNTTLINSFIIKHPSLVHKRFLSGNYFIHYCILHNAYTSIQTHLVQPHILTSQNSFGQTPLHYALQLYTKTKNDKTVLCHIIHLLIQNSPQATFLHKDMHGNTVFHLSVTTFSPTIMAEIYNRIITSKKIDQKYLYEKNHRKKMPLHLFIEISSYLKKSCILTTLIRQLLEKASHNDLMQQDEAGNTIAHLMAYFKLEEFTFLAQSHPALFAIKNNYKQLPLHILIHNFNKTPEDFLRIAKYTNNALHNYYEEDFFCASPALFYEKHHPVYTKKTNDPCYNIPNDFYKEILHPSVQNQKKSISIDSLESLESIDSSEELTACEDFKDLQPAQEDQSSPEWYQ